MLTKDRNLFPRGYVLLDKDSGGGAGDSDNKNKNGDNDDSGNNKKDGDSGSTKSITLTETELQERLNSIASKVREEEKTKFENQLKKDKADAEKKLAEEQGNFKALYESLKAEHDSLTTKSNQEGELFKSLSERVSASLKKEVEKWPDEVKSTIPENANAVQLIEWADKMRPLADKLLNVKAPEGEGGEGKGKSDQQNSIDSIIRQNSPVYVRPSNSPEREETKA